MRTLASTKPEVADSQRKVPRTDLATKQSHANAKSKQPIPEISNRGMLQRSTAGRSVGLSPAVPDLADVVEQGTSGTSRELPFRSELERYVGSDLRHIRTYKDKAAEAACQRIDAAAFTTGTNIVFGYANPERSVVVHEIAHVLQQKQASESEDRRRLRLSSPASVAEVEASRFGEAMIEGRQAPQLSQVNDSPGMVFRTTRQTSVTRRGGRPVAATINIPLEASTTVESVITDITDSLGDWVVQKSRAPTYVSEWLARQPGELGNEYIRSQITHARDAGDDVLRMEVVLEWGDGSVGSIELFGPYATLTGPAEREAAIPARASTEIEVRPLVEQIRVAPEETPALRPSVESEQPASAEQGRAAQESPTEVPRSTREAYRRDVARIMELLGGVERTVGPDRIAHHIPINSWPSGQVTIMQIVERYARDPDEFDSFLILLASRHSHGAFGLTYRNGLTMVLDGLTGRRLTRFRELLRVRSSRYGDYEPIRSVTSWRSFWGDVREGVIAYQIAYFIWGIMEGIAALVETLILVTTDPLAFLSSILRALQALATFSEMSFQEKLDFFSQLWHRFSSASEFEQARMIGRLTFEIEALLITRGMARSTAAALRPPPGTAPAVVVAEEVVVSGSGVSAQLAQRLRAVGAAIDWRAAGAVLAGPAESGIVRAGTAVQMSSIEQRGGSPGTARRVSGGQFRHHGPRPGYFDRAMAALYTSDIQDMVRRLTLSIPEGRTRNLNTVAAGLIEIDNNYRFVYMVVRNRLSEASMTIPAVRLRTAASELPITRWEVRLSSTRAGVEGTNRLLRRGESGGALDAEQLMLEAADQNNARLIAVCPSIDFCPGCLPILTSEGIIFIPPPSL